MVNLSSENIVQLVVWFIATMGMFAGFVIGASGKLPTMRLKSLLTFLFLFGFSAIYCALWLGQGYTIRSDLRSVDWLLSVLYAATSGFLVAVVYLCLDANWNKAFYGFVLGALQLGMLIGVTLSPSGDWQAQWLAYAGAAYVAVAVVTVAFIWMPSTTPEKPPMVSNFMHWAVKGVLLLIFGLELLVPFLDQTYTGNLNSLGASVFHGLLDILKVAFVIFCLGWVDLYEAGTASADSIINLAQGLPLMQGVHQPNCASNVNAPPATAEAGMRLPF
jgi:hypothetical protein